jgi:hypothetical protein
MEVFLFKIRQNSTSWIFIFSVLVGLFFSSGEGVQLFPFPITEESNASKSFSFLEKNPKSYAFSIYNFGNHSLLFKSKFQKHVNKHLAGARLIFNWSNANAIFYFHSAYNSRETGHWHISAPKGSLTDRGPPII